MIKDKVRSLVEEKGYHVAANLIGVDPKALQRFVENKHNKHYPEFLNRIYLYFREPRDSEFGENLFKRTKIKNISSNVVGDLIRVKRIQQRLTIPELSRMTKLHVETIRKIENGKVIPRIDYSVSVLADVLGLTSQEIEEIEKIAIACKSLADLLRKYNM